MSEQRLNAAIWSGRLYAKIAANKGLRVQMGAQPFMPITIEDINILWMCGGFVRVVISSMTLAPMA